MRLSIISCPFNTSFASYTRSLKRAIEGQTGAKVQWIGSNCGCGDPVSTSRQFLSRAECDYFEMPVFGCGTVTKPTWKHRLKALPRSVFLPMRARRYARMSEHANIVHFQQILDAYGSKTLFAWLLQPSTATRVITVHEFDHDQLEYP